MVSNVKIIQKMAVVCNDKVLVMKRSKDDPSRPSTWDFAGGNVDDEDVKNFNSQVLLEAIIREVKEESKIEILKDKIETIFVNSGRSDSGNLIIWIGYQYKFDSCPNVIISEEHSEYKWVAREEYENLDFGFAKNDFINTGKNIDF